MSTVKNKEPKKRTPRTKNDKEPIMRVGPRSEVLEKKIVDVYIPPQPCWNPVSVKQVFSLWVVNRNKRYERRKFKQRRTLLYLWSSE